MEECDVLVIGAGMVGASAAYELSEDARVIILEREEAPGYHSTGRSAAMYLETYGNAVIRTLTVAGRAFFQAPPDGFTEHPLVTPRGSLMIARVDQRETFEAAVAEFRAHGAGLENLDPDDALARVPVLRRDYAVAFAYEADAGDIDVHALHGGYLKGFAARGGRLVTEAELSALARRNGRWIAETRAGAFSAPVVVNAAGAWCDEVAGMAGARPIELVPKRRTAITFDPPDGVDVSAWPLVFDVEEAFYFKPEAGRVLASPCDETPMPPSDVQPEELDVAVAVDKVETATTMKVARITHKWAGLRSFVADKTPVVGFDGEAEGFFWIAGQGGYGIMTAPGISHAAVGLITKGALPVDLAERGLTEEDLSPKRLR